MPEALADSLTEFVELSATKKYLIVSDLSQQVRNVKDMLTYLLQ